MSNQPCDYTQIPGDPSRLWVGNLPEIWKHGQLHEYIVDLHRRHGETVRFDLGRQHAVSTTSPAVLATLANSGFDARPALMRPFMGWLGDGNIAFKSGQASRQTRAQLIPLLTGSVLERVCELGSRFADSTFARLPVGRPFDALAAFHSITLRTMGACCFGEAFESGPGAEIGERFMRVLRENPLDIGSIVTPLWRPAYWRWKREVATLHARVRALIETRRAHEHPEDPGSKQDLLALLLSARDADGKAFFSEPEARMAVLAFYFGGVDATAAAALWTSAMLAEHSAIQADVHQELDRVLSGRVPRLSDLSQLDTLRAVVQETLRLYPPNPLNMRHLEEPRNVGKYVVPAGTTFFLSIIAIHHCERLWPDATRFEPGRFSGPNAEGRHRFAYIPFGIGAKSCIGARFAMTEVQLMVARLLQRYRLRRAHARPLAPELRSGVLFPANDPEILLEPRPRSADRPSAAQGANDAQVLPQRITPGQSQPRALPQ